MADTLFDARGTIHRSAVISDDGLYRYRLDRWWGPESSAMGSTRLPFLMLNPSTADGDVDDPTIRRCMGFARREGFYGITVVNLYAYRATDPRELSEAVAAGIDAVGPENLDHQVDVAATAGHIVAAWGSHPATKLSGALIQMLAEEGITVTCLGVTKDGSPRHPLYVRGDQPLVPFGRAS